MNIISKMWNAVLYGGVGAEWYRTVRSDIVKTNRIMVSRLSWVASIVLTSMFFLVCVIPELTSTRIVYGAGAIISIVICILSHTICKKWPAFVAPIVYLSLESYLAYGIFIGVFTRPDQQTVTFMVMLVLMSLVFIDKPIYIHAILVSNVVTFCILIQAFKPAEIVSVDMVDAIVFGMLGMIIGTIIICMKLDSFVNRYKLRLLSESDQLTGLYNRNRYEGKLRHYAQLSGESLCCIYIDANGLHELNNTKGHQYGDAMLISIASAIQDEFGGEDAYRTGGDEFVVFVQNLPQLEVAVKIEHLRQSLAEDGYFVAIGYAHCAGISPSTLDLPHLIKTAETRMYGDKQAYYKKTGKTRETHVMEV